MGRLQLPEQYNCATKTSRRKHQLEVSLTTYVFSMCLAPSITSKRPSPTADEPPKFLAANINLKRFLHESESSSYFLTANSTCSAPRVTAMMDLTINWFRLVGVTLSVSL